MYIVCSKIGWKVSRETVYQKIKEICRQIKIASFVLFNLLLEVETFPLNIVNTSSYPTIHLPHTDGDNRLTHTVGSKGKIRSLTICVTH